MTNTTKKNKKWTPEVTLQDLNDRVDTIRELLNKAKEEYYGISSDTVDKHFEADRDVEHFLDAEKKGSFAEPERDYANEEEQL